MAAQNPTPEPIIIAVEPFGGSIRDHRAQLPLVFWDDALVTRGDGVFETLLITGGKIANFDRHAERFKKSAKLLDLPEPSLDYWRSATNEAVEKWNRISDGDAKCTWTYSRGRESTQVPTAWLTVTAVPETTLHQRQEGVKVLTSPRGYVLNTGLPTAPSEEPGGKDNPTPPWAIVGAKTLNYAANMAALRWAKSHDYDDVIFTEETKEGERILEGATSTVVIVRGDKLRTPTPGNGVLAGTTQAALFEYASQHGWRCKGKTLYIEDLEKADSVWLVSSVRMATRVRRLNDKKLPKPDNEAEIKQLITNALSQ